MTANLTCDVIAGTPVGVAAAVCGGSRVLAVLIGLRSRQEAVESARRRFPDARIALRRNEAGRQLRQYFAGRRRAFTVKPDLSALPPFHRKALEACAGIPFGRTATYGDLAAAAGSPRAARAVGSALKANPVPLVVPCHRILASSGIGGFSAPGGLDTKRSLLRHERVPGF